MYRRRSGRIKADSAFKTIGGDPSQPIGVDSPSSSHTVSSSHEEAEPAGQMEKSPSRSTEDSDPSEGSQDTNEDLVITEVMEIHWW